MELALYGDFSKIVMQPFFTQDEKLVRTYFRQFIEGLGYLHKNSVAHLDIKLENLLLTEQFTLKISDFDHAFIEGDPKIKTKGTQNSRAPELGKMKCDYPKAADIYSAGIILFALRTGSFPWTEDEEGDFEPLLACEDSEAFWKIYEEIIEESLELSPDFKELFFSMVRADPQKRVTVEEIKENSWFQGPVYSEQELKILMCEHMIDTY